MKKCIYVSQNRDKIYSVPIKERRSKLIKKGKILLIKIYKNFHYFGN